MSTLPFIDQKRPLYPVQQLCQVLDRVKRSLLRLAVGTSGWGRGNDRTGLGNGNGGGF